MFKDQSILGQIVKINGGLCLRKIVANVIAKCNLPLVSALVLSIVSRAKAKSLHAFWPIRTPRPSCANQEAWLSSRLRGQWRILTYIGASRLHTHTSRNITLMALPFLTQVLAPTICLWPAWVSLIGPKVSFRHFFASKN